LFGSGLYAEYQTTKAGLIELLGGGWRIDGHCSFCGRSSTFERTSSFYTGDGQRIEAGKAIWKTLEITCARDKSHGITFFIFANRSAQVQKVGQFPALADIANDESKEYRRVLSPQDAAEFHRAIGLASHGVGIGAYVYLRRIFERLIRGRFDEFKTAEHWMEEDFLRRRMDEKIELLKDHLPDFLVKNSRIYSILSQGIHELDEAQCMAFFPVLRSSIVVILEEDKKKKEELLRRAELEKAIAAFSNKPSPERTGAVDPKAKPTPAVEG
jgi:hypothetical protein